MKCVLELRFRAALGGMPDAPSFMCPELAQAEGLPSTPLGTNRSMRTRQTKPLPVMPSAPIRGYVAAKAVARPEAEHKGDAEQNYNATDADHGTPNPPRHGSSAIPILKNSLPSILKNFAPVSGGAQTR